ncbi:ABC transporter substrate-binding protein [Salinarimonas chemoclinalis]|uniref:ABC transporter substrate-binding protein n=1 Tax=Salinarimonas chemoclinalis TaxID=3241599 RepID=UPI0035593496
MRSSRLNTLALAASLLALGAGGAPAQDRDTLRLGMQLEPPMLDPTAGAAAAIREVTYANIFEGLVRIAGDGSVVPALAESWDISEDGLVYTFDLREGVTFHDGTPFDCAIVQFSYERAVAPESTNAQKGLFEPIASTECPDPNTAVVTLSQPSSRFLFNMAWGDAVMVAPGTAETNKTTPIGTGPYRFARWVQGDRVEMTRYDGYWGDAPAIETLVVRFISDPSAATAAMLAGDLDAFPNFPAPEALAQFENDDRFTVAIGATQGEVILSLNNSRAPFDDVRVRRALAHAIDKNAMVDAVQNGLGTPIGSFSTPASPGYVDLADAYPFDPERARALLEEAGAAGASITIHLPPPAYARRGGEVAAAYLQQVGLNVDLVPIEWAQWLEQVFRGYDFDATIIAHTEPRDLDIFARDDYYFNYDSAEYKETYQRYLAATDPDEQAAIAGELQRILSEDQPAVFLYVLPKIGVWRAGLEGLWTNQPIPANDVTEARWTQ